MTFMASSPSFERIEKGSTLTIPLPGGAAKDPVIDQNFLALAALFPLGAESLKDVFVAKVAKLPAAGEAGQIVYDKATKTFYGHNGTEWKAFH